MALSDAQASKNKLILSQLGGDALTVASFMVNNFPTACLTSGSRNYKEQAKAMARNCCAERDNHGNMLWIAETYWPTIKQSTLKYWLQVATPVASHLQQWFLANHDASEYEIVAGFCKVMHDFKPYDLRKLSKHIVFDENDKAEAFDTMPDLSNDIGPRILTYLKTEAYHREGKFIENEGGRIVWHWQAR